MRANVKETRLGMILYIDTIEEYFKKDKIQGFYVDVRDRLYKLLHLKLDYEVNLDGLMKVGQSPWEKYYSIPMRVASRDFHEYLESNYGSASLETFKKWKKEWAEQGYAKRIRKELEEESFGKNDEFQGWKRNLLLRVFESEYHPEGHPPISPIPSVPPTIQPPEIRDAAFYFGNRTAELFEKFISEARSSIQILTHSISSQAAERIFANVKPIKSVEIVTFRRSGTKRIQIFLEGKGVKKVEIKRYQYLHAKLCIQDGKKVLVTSANITVGSLGSSSKENFLEASIVSSNDFTVKKALALFSSISKEENIQSIEGVSDEDFLSSAYGIPKKILAFIKESKEICIIVPPLIDDYILSVLKGTNTSLDIKIVTPWPSRVSKNYRNGLLLLNKFGEYKLIDFMPVRQRIHAKIYLFTLSKGYKVAFISSLNITRNSWYANVETGVTTRDERIIAAIDKVISKFTRVSTENPPEILHPDSGGGRGSSEDDNVKELSPIIIPEGQAFIDEFDKLYKEFINNYKDLYEEVGISAEKILVQPEPEEEIDAKDVMERNFVFPVSENFPEVIIIPLPLPLKEIDGMTYMYAIMMLGYSGKPINEENVCKIFDTIGVSYDRSMVKMVVENVSGIPLENLPWCLKKKR